MANIEFHYFGEEEEGSENADIDDPVDSEPRTTRTNSAGQKIRGKDLNWRSKMKFSSAQLYHDSSLFKELKENFTLKRNQEADYGVVHKYICKFAQKTRYHKCDYQIKVVFPSKDLDVIVEECNAHEHILKDDYVDSNQVYRWSPLATEIIVFGIKSGASPKVILRNMREKGCFTTTPEPSMQQLYNKIANMKKILNLSESVENTHDLREKIKDHLKVPENDIEGYVAYNNIQDENEDEETRFTVIFATKRTLAFLKRSNCLNVDATYRLNWHGYPVVVVGCTSTSGKFFASFTALTSHEDSKTWKEIYSFVHSLGVHPKYRMSDGAQAITRAGSEVFSSCPDCQDSDRLMCWSHTIRAVQAKIKPIEKLDKKISKQILQDLDNVQYSVNDDTFTIMIDKLESKYCENDSHDQSLKSALNTFFSYFRSVWVDSSEFRWYEGSHPFASSNNQGMEAKNKSIKQSHTFRRLMPLGPFIDTCLQMVHEWALEDYSNLDSSRNETLFAQPDGLKLRSAGYDWLSQHKSNTNFVKIPSNNLKTLLPNTQVIWAVPSSFTKLTEDSLKEIAKQRIMERFEIPESQTFDESMKVRQSCHLIEQINDEFFCDCLPGIKGKMCKHAVGMLYKTGIMEITSDVRSKPLGQKRKRGRPKKIPHCLQKSPEPRTVGSVAQASYINPSPDVSLTFSDSNLTTSPPRVSSVIPFIPQLSPSHTSRSPTTPQVSRAPSPAVASPQPPASPPVTTRTRRRQQKDDSNPVFKKPSTRSKRQREMDPDLPPAKRISRSRQTLKITFCLEQEKIVDKKKTRTSKNKK